MDVVCASCCPPPAPEILYIFCTKGDLPSYTYRKDDNDARKFAELISKKDPGKMVTFGRVLGHLFTPEAKTVFTPPGK